MDFNMRQKMKICEVLNKETNQRDEKYAYRIGRICYLPEYIIEDKPMSWIYENGAICTSSSVEKFDEDDGGVWVYTKNRVYDFQYAYDDNEEVIDYGIDIR
jgi:hypothetical protein